MFVCWFCQTEINAGLYLYVSFYIFVCLRLMDVDIIQRNIYQKEWKSLYLQSIKHMKHIQIKCFTRESSAGVK